MPWLLAEGALSTGGCIGHDPAQHVLPHASMLEELLWLLAKWQLLEPRGRQAGGRHHLGLQAPTGCRLCVRLGNISVKMQIMGQY